MELFIIFPEGANGTDCNSFMDLELEIPIDIKSIWHIRCGAGRLSSVLLRTGSPSALQGRPEKQQGDEEIKIILHHKCCSVFVLLPKNYLPLLHTITQTCSNTANPPCFDIAIKQNCSKARQKWRCGFQIPYFQAPARHLHKSSSTKCSAR